MSGSVAIEPSRDIHGAGHFTVMDTDVQTVRDSFDSWQKGMGNKNDELPGGSSTWDGIRDTVDLAGGTATLSQKGKRVFGDRVGGQPALPLNWGTGISKR